MWLKLNDWSLPKKLLLLGAILSVLILGALVVAYFTGRLPHLPAVQGVSTYTPPAVSVPTIINGELVLPKVSETKTNTMAQFGENNRLMVESAVIVPVFEQDKLVGVRVLGEMRNRGSETIDGISPVVRFFDKDNKVVGQKIASFTPNYNFFSLESGSRMVYDFTVSEPPSSEKVEIMVNVSSATSSAVFEPLKIASRSMEIKTATTQTSGGQEAEGTSSGTESPAKGKEVQYFIVSGSVVNTQPDAVSEITIYAWAKGEDGKVINLEKQEFKNDLLVTGGKLDFKITLLPLNVDTQMTTYELAAWGKRYKLDLPN